MIHAHLLLRQLKECQVTHVLGLPDNSSAALFALLKRDSDIRLINVTREGEAFAMAAGLWMGGKTPVVLIQNTGFLESGDGFRGTASRMRIPLLCLITYRGFARMGDYRPGTDPNILTPDVLSRPELDSVALVTEPTLKAWGVPFEFSSHDGDLPKIEKAQRRAEMISHPVAVLITEGLI